MVPSALQAPRRRSFRRPETAMDRPPNPPPGPGSALHKAAGASRCLEEAQLHPPASISGRKSGRGQATARRANRAGKRDVEILEVLPVGNMPYGLVSRHAFDPESTPGLLRELAP